MWGARVERKKQEPHGLQVARSPTQKIQKSWEITRADQRFQKTPKRQGQLSKTISFPVCHQLPSRNWLKITFKTAKTNTPTENLNSNKAWQVKSSRRHICGCCVLFYREGAAAHVSLAPPPGPWLHSQACVLSSLSQGQMCSRSSPTCLLSPSLTAALHTWGSLAGAVTPRGLCGQAVPASPPG